MTRVAVRSSALWAAASRLDEVAAALREDASAVLAVLTVEPWSGGGGWGAVAGRAGARAEVLRLVGPAGLWGRALDVDGLAVRLRVAARGYEEVEDAANALLSGVAAGADLGRHAGWFDDGRGPPVVTEVGSAFAVLPVLDPPALVALGEGLDGGRVRVVEVDSVGGGSAWVVVVPGTQEWGPRAGANPFDATTDVRAVTGASTVAAAGVTGALELARSRSSSGSASDPVLLAGHSQGGILAAALASEPAFTRRHRVTHVLTTGSPVGVFPVPPSVRMLSVEHTADPVPTLDLTPNPARATWTTLRVGAPGVVPVDVGAHDREAYRRTLAAAAGAPRGTVPGVDAWRVSAHPFLGRPVRSVTEVEVQRPP